MVKIYIGTRDVRIAPIMRYVISGSLGPVQIKTSSTQKCVNDGNSQGD